MVHFDRRHISLIPTIFGNHAKWCLLRYCECYSPTMDRLSCSNAYDDGILSYYIRAKIWLILDHCLKLTFRYKRRFCALDFKIPWVTKVEFSQKYITWLIWYIVFHVSVCFKKDRLKWLSPHVSRIYQTIYAMSMASSLRVDPIDIYFMHDDDSILLSFHRLDRFFFFFCKQWMEFKMYASLFFSIEFMTSSII